MKRKSVKNFVLPAIYVLIVITSFFSISMLNSLLVPNDVDNDYSKSLLKEPTESVLKETSDKEFSLPYNGAEVKLITSYYSKDDDESIQQKSLITYEKTYMPSSGAMYSCAKDFDVLSIYDGVVKSISKDNILGNVIEITHNTNFTSFYYSLKDITVNVKDNVKTGDIIGKADKNKINEKDNNVLIEVYYQGKSINPEKLSELNPDEMQ